MEKEVILKLDFDIEDFSKSAAELNKQIVQLNNEQQNLKKTNQEGSLEFQKNKEKLTELKREYNDNQKVIQNLTKANKAQAGSMEQMKAQLSILTKQYDLLSKEERENSEEGKKLQSQINKLTSSLKQNEEAVGNHRRSVGDYAKGLNEAGGVTGGMIQRVKGFSGSLKLLLANPVVLVVSAIVGVLKLLYDSFTKTEKGSNALNKGMTIVSTVFSGLMKIIEPIANFIADVFVEAFEKLGEVAEMTANIVSKVFSFLGFDEAAESVKNFVNGSKEAIELGKQIADQESEMLVLRREQKKIQYQAQLDAEKLRQIRDDESKSMAERKKANEDLGKVLEEQAVRELSIAQKELDLINKKIKAEGETTDLLDAKAEAEFVLIDINERITGQQSEQLANLNSLRNEEKAIAKERQAEAQRRKDEAQKQAEAEAKIVEERLKREAEAYKELDALEISRISDVRERQRMELQAKFDDKIAKLKEDNEAEKELAKQLAIELQNELNELDATFKAEDEAKKQEALMKELDLKMYLAQEDLKAQNLLLQAKRDAELQNAKLTATEKAVIEKKYNDQIAKNEAQLTQMKQAENNARLNNLKSITALSGQIAKASGQETKGFALAEVAIDTALAISNLTANSEGNPANSFTFGAAGIAQYVAGLSRIFANINQARSIISGAGFAEGGYTGDGGKYEVAGVVHRGEYVVPKHIVSNSNYSGVIANLEAARLKGYANGGMVASNLTKNIDNDFQNRQNLFNLVASLPSPVVVVQDINEVQSDVNKVQVKADI